MNLKLMSLLSVLLVSFQVDASTSSKSNKVKLSGVVRVDGSSTVFPITEAVAEEFGKVQPRVRVTVGVSGTGGGFKKFTKGEIDINDASRRIKDKEKKRAQKNKVEYMEIPVAFDGISIVVNPKNDWVDELTVAELNKIWKPGSTVKTWKDVRASWPDKEIKLYGPGTDSGTFDYFTKVINGKSQKCRSNYTKSEDDNVLVKGVAGDKYSLGFFGFAYYIENKGKVKSVPIRNKGEKKAVSPTAVTINNGSYAPLSRPVFIYVGKKASQKPQVREFTKFYIQQAGALSKEVGYVPLPQKDYDSWLEKYKQFSK